MAGHIQTLDGEIELWRGAPAWKKSGWTTQEKLMFLIGAALIVAPLVLGIIFSEIGEIYIISAFGVIYAALPLLIIQRRHQDVEYVLTDRRIIIAKSKQKGRISIPLSAISTVALTKRSECYDVNLLTNSGMYASYAYPGSGSAKLYALEDAAAFEKALMSMLHSGQKK